MADPWIEKAVRMQRETECFPSVTILKATLWLEKNHQEAPHYDTAVIISLHYLVLALRKKRPRCSAQALFIQALMWRREAINQLAQSTSASL